MSSSRSSAWRRRRQRLLERTVSTIVAIIMAIAIVAMRIVGAVAQRVEIPRPVHHGLAVGRMLVEAASRFV